MTTKTARKIIKIDEDLCTGCGECIISCAESALELVDGKAKLVGDILCDGLGACLGECPEGALEIIERDAVEFDEQAVEERIKELEKDKAPEPTPHMCPGARAMSLNTDAAPAPADDQGDTPSRLGHWPVKLQLLSPSAPYLKGADLLLAADCTAFAYPKLNTGLLGGKAVAIGCPKLDNLDAHIERLADILKTAQPASLTVIHMEVPCCHGFVHAAQKALEISGSNLTLKRINISVDGKVIEEVDMSSETA